MPITAQEALEISNTLELNEKEKTWFNKLCELTDIRIKNHFDGNSISIGFENMFYNGTNYGWQPYSLPCWRQVAVVRVWIKTYEDIGWKFTPRGEKWSCNKYHYRYSEYLMEPDIRDMKIKEILEN